MGKIKTVNLRDQDVEIVEFLDGLKNFSEWVRQKAAYDIAKQRTGVDPEIAAYIDRILEVKLAGCTISTDQPKKAIPYVEDAVKSDIEKMF